MSLDGWSNIHKDPIVCVGVTSNYKTYLVDTVVTQPVHSCDNLREIMGNSIKKTKREFNCRTGSVVTDNAANMVKMRRELETEDLVLTYGCRSHLLNLLAHDFCDEGEFR